LLGRTTTGSSLVLVIRIPEITAFGSSFSTKTAVGDVFVELLDSLLIVFAFLIATVC